jgi:ABC-type Co2+ transport system permease subunit
MNQLAAFVIFAILLALLFISDRLSNKILRYVTLSLPLWLFPVLTLLNKQSAFDAFSLLGLNTIAMGWVGALVIYSLYHYFLEREEKAQS